MIIDAFPFAYGPEVLLLRLRELSDVVDRFVIVEGNRTHTGAEREPLWPMLRDLPEFALFADRVCWHWQELPGAMTPWQREEALRDVVWDEARSHALPDGRILFGDHDEIPHPNAVRFALGRPEPIARLWTRYHEWFLDLAAAGRADRPFRWEFRQPLLASPRRLPWRPSGAELRASQGRGHGDVLELGRPGSRLRGWHMTLQGGASAVHGKLQICAHTELQRITLSEVERRIAGRLDILDRCALVRTTNLPATLAGYPEFWAERGMLLPVEES